MNMLFPPSKEIQKDNVGDKTTYLSIDEPHKQVSEINKHHPEIKVQSLTCKCSCHKGEDKVSREPHVGLAGSQLSV